MSMGDVVVFTTLLAFCIFISYTIGRRYGYKKGHEVGAKMVLKQWNNWINEVGDEE